MQTQNNPTGFFVQFPQSWANLFGFIIYSFITLFAIAFIVRHSFSGGGSDGGFTPVRTDTFHPGGHFPDGTGIRPFLSETGSNFRFDVPFDVKSTKPVGYIGTPGVSTVPFVWEHIKLNNYNKMSNQINDNFPLSLTSGDCKVFSASSHLTLISSKSACEPAHTIPSNPSFSF
jgi:hypothetical protein